MQNDPSLHQDQQNQADHLIKAKGVEQTAKEMKSDDEEVEKNQSQDPAQKNLSEAEKADQTDPKDFEPFNLDKVDDIKKGDE